MNIYAKTREHVAFISLCVAPILPAWLEGTVDAWQKRRAEKGSPPMKGAGSIRWWNAKNLKKWSAQHDKV